MTDIIIFLFLIALGYTAGEIAERMHYKSINLREDRYRAMPLVSITDTDDAAGQQIKGTRLVMGSAVISVDYFKKFIFGIRNLFGGEVSSYAGLVDRARREALLRMIESVEHLGTPDMILNVRIETSVIGSSLMRRRNRVSSIEALAYGTAIYQKNSDEI
jgi:uncharacterized protein YbjQ (UPF0145 family)